MWQYILSLHSLLHIYWPFKSRNTVLCVPSRRIASALVDAHRAAVRPIRVAGAQRIRAPRQTCLLAPFHCRQQQRLREWPWERSQGLRQSRESKASEMDDTILLTRATTYQSPCVEAAADRAQHRSEEERTSGGFFFGCRRVVPGGEDSGWDQRFGVDS